MPVRRQHLVGPRSRGARRRGPRARRRRLRRRQSVHVRHRGPRAHRRRRRGPRSRPPGDRGLLAALPGSDLRAHRPRPAARRERRRLCQRARGLLVRPPRRAGPGPGEGPRDRPRRGRPRPPASRPAALTHLPAPRGARGRRRHRRHDGRRRAGRRRHRGTPGRALAQPGRLHGAPLQDLSHRGLRDVLARAAPHDHRPRVARARAHADRGRRDQRTARRVPREAAPQAALRDRGLRGLRASASRCAR